MQLAGAKTSREVRSSIIGGTAAQPFHPSQVIAHPAASEFFQAKENGRVGLMRILFVCHRRRALHPSTSHFTSGAWPWVRECPRWQGPSQPSFQYTIRPKLNIIVASCRTAFKAFKGQPAQTGACRTVARRSLGTGSPASGRPAGVDGSNDAATPIRYVGE